jgi:uncharacterized membrane protein YgcG
MGTASVGHPRGPSRSRSTVTSTSRGGKTRTRTLTYQGRPTTLSGKGVKNRAAPQAARRTQRRVSRAADRVQRARRSSPRLTAPYDPDEAASLVKRVGGTTAEARALSTKITGESGGDPKAVGHDPGGTTGLGLWQMTTGVGNDDLIAKHGGEQAMLRPKPNARAALELYRGGGIGNWYAPSNAPGNPRGGKRPARKDLKVLAKASAAGIKTAMPKPKAKPKDKPKKKPGPWAGSQKAVLSKVPEATRPEGRGDKRTPAENSSVGGATNSDHLTTNQRSYAADLPAQDSVAQHIAKKLGMGSHTGTNQVVKNGYQYTLIWQDEGHYDHIHLGAEYVGKGIPPGTTLGGPSGSSTSGGGSISSGGGSSSGGSASSGKGGVAAIARATGKSVKAVKQMAKSNPKAYRSLLAQMMGATSDTGPSGAEGAVQAVVPQSLRRKYGKPAV